MSRFRLHTISNRKDCLRYLAAGLACVAAVGTIGYLAHSVGTARAKSRETVLIYTEEEFEQYLLDRESEDYNLDGRYQLETDLDLSWLDQSIGTNLEPFTGKLDGNGHVIIGLERPMFGVMKKAEAANLFFSDARITRPYTYSDGERYVDGYGALSAYVIDSVIENCGMNGEIITSRPVETEYLLAKASPSDADEQMESGAEGPAGEGSQVESSPVMEGNEAGGPGGGAAAEDAADGAESADTGGGADTGSGDGAAGPGVETGAASDSAKTETSAEIGPGVETTAETAAGESSETSAQESGNAGTQPSVGESGSGNTNSTEKPSEKVDTPTAGESGFDSFHPSESTETAGENGTETAGESSIEKTDAAAPESNSSETRETATEISSHETQEAHTEVSVENKKETAQEAKREAAGETASQVKPEEKNRAVPETIGFWSHDRQYLMMKAPTVIDPGMGEMMTASPSNATPADADTAPEESRTEAIPNGENTEDETMGPEEPQYIGNPDGDMFILVTAERITAGGLIAETAGETLVSGSFALVTMSSAQETTEAYNGGMVGILGGGSRAENSYAAGLADSSGVAGGFTAVNEGTVENSYVAVTMGNAGTQRGAFTAMGNGRLNGCVYDRQMACTDEGELEQEAMDEETVGERSPSEASEFRLIGLKTAEIIGSDSRIPGTWRKTVNAYPQLDYFAEHEHELVKASSRASAIALVLPGELTLTDVVKNGDIVLPSEIDGEVVNWEAEGNIRIDEKNQVISEEAEDELSIETRERAVVKSALEESSVAETSAADQPVEEAAVSAATQEAVTQDILQETERISGSGNPQLKASVGNVTRNFALRSVQPEIVTYADWGEVGAAQTEADLKRKGALSGSGLEGNPWKIGTEEALAWFVYQTNQDISFQDDHVELTANMNLIGSKYGGTADIPLAWISIPRWSGIFDGGDYELDYMYIDTTIDITEEPKRAGLVLILDGGGTIKNVHIGSNSYMKSSYNTAAIAAVGMNGFITDCSNAGTLEGKLHTGGIVGIIEGTKITITRCGNTGNIHSSEAYVGGIIGWGAAKSSAWSGTVIDCYNTGNISAEIYPASGLVTTNPNKISLTNCYNIGTVFSPKGSYEISWQGVMANCYKLTGSGGGITLSMDQMKSWALPYALNGQSMDGPWQYNEGGTPIFGKLQPPANWGVIVQGTNDGLMNVGKLTAGNGAASTPYQITNAAQFATFASKVNSNEPGACGILMGNIDLTGAMFDGTEEDPIPWVPIGSGVTDDQGTSIYTGTFAGNGKIVYGMKVKTDGYAGLFGCVGGNASVTKLGLDKTCSVEAVSPGTSGMDGTAGLIGAIKPVGGVAKVTLAHCYNRARIHGKSANTAALIGSDESTDGTGAITINKCYTTGTMTTSSGVPSALIGPGKGNKSVTISNSYWDAGIESGYTGGLSPAGAGFAGNAQTAAKKPATDMKLQAFATLLNQGESTAVWEWNENKNNAYPIFAGMAAFATWENVGAAAEVPSTVSAADKGTAANPYLIKSPENLAWFAYQVNQGGNPAICGKLMADISLFGGLYTGGNGYDGDDNEILARALPWIPIGSDVDGKRYTGTFDGNGHVIYKIRTTGADKQGLFGTLGNDAKISKLGVSTILTEAPFYSGGIAGYVNGTGVKITECGNLGSITVNGDGFYLGGCVGGTSDTSSMLVDGCYNDVKGMVLSKGDNVGGILGSADKGNNTIQNCYNRGTVSGKSIVGGIVGSMNKTIYRCYNAGTVSGTGEYFGGIIGDTVQNPENCFYETGTMGAPGATMVEASILKTWGAAWKLNGGQVSQDTGIFWDYDGKKNGGYPYPSSGTPNGAVEWNTVMEGVKNGFVWIGQPSGDPYRISTAEQLAWFAYEVNHGNPGASAVIIEDIDMTVGEKQYMPEGRLSWMPMGADNAPFTGTLDSSNPSDSSDTKTIYKIKNLYVNTSGRAGLFGTIAGGTVSRIGLSNPKVISNGSDAGGIAGRMNGGQITRCYNRGEGEGIGTVTTSQASGVYCGGIVGQMSENGVIKDCYNLDVRISGAGSGTCVGGITGGMAAGSAIRNSYNSCGTLGGIEALDGAAAGSIAGKAAAGGTISQCYRDAAFGADGAGIKEFDTATDTSRQKEVKDLNTTDGGTEKTGDSRVWYTSLALEESRGMPTLDAPVQLQVELDPAQVTADAGIMGTLNGTVPDAKLRGIRQETGTVELPTLALTSLATITSKFSSYGYESANKNLGLAAVGAAQNKDLGSVKLADDALVKPTETVGSFDQLALYCAAAYTCPTDRVILVDLADASTGTTRYEIQVTIKGITSKTLSVELPAEVTVKITPDGTHHKSYSTNMSMKNNNTYPVEGSIIKLTPLTGNGYVTLPPVIKSVDITTKKGQITDPNVGVWLGIDRPDQGATGTVIPSGGLYYTQGDEAGNVTAWMKYRLKGGVTLNYSYFLEYAADPYYVESQNKFGYEVGYQFEIAQKDDDGLADAVVSQ